MSPRERFTETVEALWLASLDLTDATYPDQYAARAAGQLISSDRMDYLANTKVHSPPTLFDQNGDT